MNKKPSYNEIRKKALKHFIASHLKDKSETIAHTLVEHLDIFNPILLADDIPYYYEQFDNDGDQYILKISIQRPNDFLKEIVEEF